jgi:protein-L-isoaspartate(D-aspartate) O-methyltransferase
MNLEQARFNMVEQQVRPWDVLDQRVLDRLAEVPREDFVPPAYKNLAYADTQIPIGQGQVMLPPKIEARLLQALDLKESDLVLEIGTGTGYLTAVMAGLAGQVISVDIFPELQRLPERYLKNVSLEVGDAAQGWSKGGPFDAIAVTGSLPSLPKAFLEALKLEGRLFVVLGRAPAMEAVLITRVGEREWSREGLFETVIPPLLNSEPKLKFTF